MFAFAPPVVAPPPTPPPPVPPGLEDGVCLAPPPCSENARAGRATSITASVTPDRNCFTVFSSLLSSRELTAPRCPRMLPRDSGAVRPQLSQSLSGPAPDGHSRRPWLLEYRRYLAM